MPHHETIALSGVVHHVFAHRFTLEAGGAMHLADLGPKGLERFPLEAGLAVTLEGERRPSEIKVTRIEAAGGKPVLLEHKKPNHAPKHRDGDAPADPVRMLEKVRGLGWAVTGEPRRKPKHFELLARRDGGAWTELHVGLDGAVTKEKPADIAKWADAA